MNSGFLTLRETGINAESMAGSERSFRPYFCEICDTSTACMNDYIDYAQKLTDSLIPPAESTNSEMRSSYF